MNAIEELMAEHRAVLLTIDILNEITGRLEAGETANVKHLEDLLEFLRVFVDRCHHGKEERILFPAMEDAGIPRQGGPIGVMLYEHEEGRKFIRGFSQGIDSYKEHLSKRNPSAEALKAAARKIRDNARNYGELLSNHIEKENNVLYPIALRAVPPETMVAMETAFERLEIDEIGAGRHEEFHEMLHGLKEIYL